MEFTTKGGSKIVLKDSITGGDYQDIQDVMFKASKMNGENINVGGEVITEMLNKAIGLIVMSVNGNSENVLQAIRDLSVNDYNEVVDKVNEIKDGMSAEKKTK